MDRGRKWLSMLMVVLFTILVLATLMLISAAGPVIETRFFPVVRKLQISELRAGDEPGTSVFMATFTKIRACKYVTMAWYDAYTDERVGVELKRQKGETKKVTRVVGQATTGPWIINLPPDRIVPPFGWWAKREGWKGSYARLFHQCPIWENPQILNPFWLTTTDFYP